MSHNEPVPSPWLVPFDGSFRVAAAPAAPGDQGLGKRKAQKDLDEEVERLSKVQKLLYASNSHAVLIVFQALDAAGKDGTIRAVMTGINPAGCQVYSFKAPSHEELDHDFLWRTSVRLPERGRIGIFNRSYYEEVLVVRVHPELLDAQSLPHRPESLDRVWEQRYESIRCHEQHLARNGTVILKFWLNVSRAEQKRRFLERLEDPDKHWKFAAADVAEGEHWKEYMAAYQDALNATSRPWAPWYAIPADDKPTMRVEVARIVRETLERLDMRYPDGEVDVEAMRKRIAGESE